MKRWIVLAIICALGAFVSAPSPASAKAKKDPCRKADAKMALTGEGDSDGDGLSDCREQKQLGTKVDDPDSDHDGVSDGDEVKHHCDPMDADSDHDGVEDGDDETLGILEQEVKAFFDALTCL